MAAWKPSGTSLQTVEVPRLSSSKFNAWNQAAGRESGDKRARDIVREALRMYVSRREPGDLRETMQRGYQEMAPLNLRIACEAFLVEQEAGNTVERLVSGV
ncbi:putative transcriptional regulator, CopG family [Alicyclobacillus acidocaldarius subsp. acidocaldarius Tc-4-1]|uniref:Putative transcriptional regulator, CopG family n=1 Tax=Alicyclobacillus acidocaldarius (strain Tc-4-1) TaxID=1048834 RepID=F8ICH0_ALIAT|nr:putative transcriptional regulator, CopG family [Alicyclobacillus acidocaldarius subsp. acidocaldarius Tc-4-1]